MIIHHRGKCGDLIALCAWLTECHHEEKAKIVVTQHRSFHPHNVDWIRPLLLEQPNVESIQMVWNAPYAKEVIEIPCDVKAARKAAENGLYTGWWVDTPSWWQQAGAVRNDTDLRYRFPTAYKEEMPQFMMPWLKVPECQRIIKEPYIVVSVTPRYGCCQDFTQLARLQKDYRIIFLGDKGSYDMYCQGFSEYYPVEGSIQAAQLIRDCSLFLGCQTLHFWLAQALGVDRVVSTSPKFHDCHLKTLKGFRTTYTADRELKDILELWLKYKDRQEKQGVLISTYGSPAYIDLQLALHKGLWGHDTVVYDDGSRNEKLKEVCNKWEVPLLGVDDPPKGHQLGDYTALKTALVHFKDKEWVYKVSRRCLWLQDFQKLSKNYQNAVVLSGLFAPQKTHGFAVNSNCIGFHLPKFPEGMKETLLSITELPSYVQRVICAVFKKFLKEPFTFWKEVFLNRENGLTTDKLLWHRQVPAEAYKKVADSLSLKWDLKDFQELKTQ